MAVSLWTALAIVLIVEGVLPLVAPQAWRRAVIQIAQLRDGQIRSVALIAVLAGLTLLWV